VPDLITQAQVLAALDLSVADQARVPTAISSASRMVRNYCGRYFSRRPSADGTLAAIDELITSPLSGRMLLQEYPINDVLRVSSSKTTIFSTSNLDQVTNQRATAKLLKSGDEIAGFVTAGLYLERWASGVKIPATILFSSLANPTIGALAGAVNALGGGWTASAAQRDGSGTDYSLWAVGELRAGQGTLGALGGGAEFQAWTDDLGCEWEAATGILTISEEDRNAFTSTRWGPNQGLTFGDDTIRGERNGVRVVYDAGYDVTPEDLADATVEVVKLSLERKAISGVVQAERTDTWAITTREVLHALSPANREVLSLYRSHSQ
jgi:hypothetical protein